MRLHNGPPPTPTPILKARGSWRAKIRKGEPAFSAKVPSCPTFLLREAKAEWRRQIKHLSASGLIQTTDRAALAAYCEAWGEFVLLLSKVSYDGEMDWRLINLKNAAADRLIRLASQFGFSPAARARLATNDGKQVEPSGKSRFFA